MDKKLTITDSVSGKQVDFPITDGTHGPSVCNISSLYNELGYFTFDPGFQVTASCKSAVTFIDGDKGELLYRGYPVEQLAEKSSFLRISYLLMYGELPNEAEHDEFTRLIGKHNVIKESLQCEFFCFTKAF